ncbi:MAG: hypothetical protein HY703_08745 [Gemmatimonadetes bacterium]|nr:hypothetical protein [Gemmatimonadota bacterium]
MKPLLMTLCCTAMLLLPAAGAAQQRAQRFEPENRAEKSWSRRVGGVPPLRFAKWATVAASVASAAYGFSVQHDSDEKFRALEARCQQQPQKCSQRLPDERYQDPELEAMYQDVVRLDRRARMALLASQVGVAASVLLFILDLREESTPPNIPYDPERFQIQPRADGGVELRFAFPAAP